MPVNSVDGAHFVLYSSDPEEDRRFFRDVIGLPSVDAGEGWLIFALPKGELGIHPAKKRETHSVDLYLTCKDLDAALKSFKRQGVKVRRGGEQEWGKVAFVNLPSGTELGIYEPKHPSPHGGGTRSRETRRL